MKRTKLRRVSKNPIKRLKDRVDRVVQDWYRANYPDEKCECCGRPFELMHHFILKSHCNALRYHKANLIFICSKCHAKIHMFGASELNALIGWKRGKLWYTKIMKLKNTYLSLTPKYLNEIYLLIKAI